MMFFFVFLKAWFLFETKYKQTNMGLKIRLPAMVLLHKKPGMDDPDWVTKAQLDQDGRWQVGRSHSQLAPRVAHAAQETFWIAPYF